MVVPYLDLTRELKKLKPKLSAAMKRVLDSGHFVMAEEGASFEQEFSKFIGTKYGTGVNSGTDALKIALRALGVGLNDEVITVTNTAVPTVSAIRETGAIPVFVDIDEFFNMDSSKIEEAITKKTKAIVVVHLYGEPADMPRIMQVAKRNKLKVVEDCAHATGAEIAGKKIGTFGDMSCFSFYPTKNLGACGDGGIILTNSKTLNHAARLLRKYGMEKIYYANREGYNSRLEEFQAAFLRAKLPYLSKWNARRREIAKYYLTHITNPKVELPKSRTGYVHVYHLFVVRVKNRKHFREYLTKHGIGSAVHYEFPIHLQKAYRFLGYLPGSLPKSERAAKEIVSLPLFPELTASEIKNVVDVINSY